MISIINSLSTQEKRAFKRYLDQKNKRKDTKNKALFELLCQDTPLTAIDTILYKTPNRNAYHALSKRVQDNLIDFIAERSINTDISEDTKVYKYVIAARALYQKNIPKKALSLLQKAINKGKELELYTVVSEAYHTLTQYCHLHPEISLKKTIDQTLKNQEYLANQERINLACALIKQDLTYHPNTIQQDLKKSIENTFKQLNIAITTKLSFKSLYQLLEIIDKAAHIKHNYNDALPYFKKLYEQINTNTTKQSKNKRYHLEVLYLMANAHLRNRAYNTAQEYLNKINLLIKDETHKHPELIQKITLISCLLLNYSGKAQQAITSIENYVSSLKKEKTSPNIILALTLCYIQQETFKKALTTVNKLQHSIDYYQEHQGLDWVIKKELIILIIYLELGYVDLTTSKLRSFKRKFNNVLATELRLQHFLNAFQKIFNNPDITKSPRFRESIKSNFNSQDLQKEDLLILSFWGWLKSKINNTPLYSTTLDILKC